MIYKLKKINDKKNFRKTILISLGLISFMVNAQDDNQSKGDQKSASEIAVELANPNTTLGTLNFNFDYINYQGDLPNAGNQNSVTLGFQPVLPIPLNKTVNLFVRPNIPFILRNPFMESTDLKMSALT